MRYAVVTTVEIPKTRFGRPAVPANTVVNVILWDSVEAYNPGPNLRLIQSDTLQIGDTVAP